MLSIVVLIVLPSRTHHAEAWYVVQGSGSVLATKNLHLVKERDSMHAWDLSDEGGIHEHSQFLHLKLRKTAKSIGLDRGRTIASKAHLCMSKFFHLLRYILASWIADVLPDCLARHKSCRMVPCQAAVILPACQVPLVPRCPYQVLYCHAKTLSGSTLLSSTIVL